jgi:hypothetical protein
MCHGSALSEEVRKKSPVKTIGGTAEKSRGILRKSPKNAALPPSFFRLFSTSISPHRLILSGFFLNNSLITALSG